jgi:WD40 repeat protein
MKTAERRFYVAGGTMESDAPSYVERQADRELYEALNRGEFCYVLDSRQMGKSSLMIRAIKRLCQEGAAVAAIDLTRSGQNLTAQQWYSDLLCQLGEALQLEDELDAFWLERTQLSPLQQWMHALREVVLPQCPGRVVIFIDEIDTVRDLPFATDEFFAAIRECYNRRAQDPEFHRLTFCLLGVATPSELIENPRTTPFNIGRRIELHDFSEMEAALLAEGLGRSASLAAALLRRVLYWTGGHPYLTQRLCQAVAEDARVAGSDGVDRLCNALFLRPGALDQDRLALVPQRLRESEATRAALLDLYSQVLDRTIRDGTNPVVGALQRSGLQALSRRMRSGLPVRDDDSNPLVGILRLSGMIRVVEASLQVRNRIYERVFNREWVTMHMPEAELRRQRAAYRRGLWRAASISGVILAMVTSLALTAVGQLWVSYLAQARALRFSGHAGRRFESLALLRRASRIHPSLELRNEAIACLALADLQAGKPKQSTEQPPETSSLAFDPNVERYARSDGQGNISIRRVGDDHETIFLPGPGYPAWGIRFSPDGRFLAGKYHPSAQENPNWLQVWDVRRGKMVLNTRADLSGTAIAFTPDSHFVAIGHAEGPIYGYELASGKRVKRLTAGPPAGQIAFDPEGRKLAVSGLQPPTVQIWDVTTGKVVRELAHPRGVNGIAWSPDGRFLATACADFNLYIWNMATDQAPTVLSGHDAEPTLLAFSHGGDLLASVGWDGRVLLWDSSSGRLLVESPGNDAATPQFSLDDRVLGVAKQGPKIQIWEVAKGHECRTLLGHQGGKGPWSVDFSLDGRLMASAGADGVRLWDVDGAREVQWLPIGDTSSAVFHPGDGSLITSGGGGLHRWPIKRDTGRLAEGLRIGPPQTLGLPGQPDRCCLSADGRSVAVAYHSHAYVLQAESPSQKVLLSGQPGLTFVSMSPDSKWVATGTWHGSNDVTVWDAQRGNRVHRFPVGGDASVAFSPDGRWLVASPAEGYRFWEVGSWRPGPHLRSDSERWGPMAFTRDGQVLAIAYSPRLVKLISAESGREFATLEPASPRSIAWLCFSPDGSQLAVASDTHRIQLWDLRLIREQLAAMRLDWDLPPYPPASTSRTRKPVRTTALAAAPTLALRKGGDLSLPPGQASKLDLKYAALGGSSGFLGPPIEERLPTPDGFGCYRHYRWGSIYWSPQTGAHEVHGAIVKEWLYLGWERSFLGYPKTDESRTPDGIGRFNHFQGGSIYWTPQTGAHEVHGDIRRRWAELGWEKSNLGYPISDEQPKNHGRISLFQHGSISISWKPEGAARDAPN